MPGSNSADVVDQPGNCGCCGSRASTRTEERPVPAVADALPGEGGRVNHGDTEANSTPPRCREFGLRELGLNAFSHPTVREARQDAKENKNRDLLLGEL